MSAVGSWMDRFHATTEDPTLFSVFWGMQPHYKVLHEVVEIVL